MKFAGLNPAGERMQILKAGVLYFAVVFGAGFVPGPIRIVWVVPPLGARMAELLEAPIMLVVTIVAARWIIRKFAVAHTPSSRLGAGGIAVSLLMIIAEFTLVPWLRGLSIRDYIAGRDPVAATVYYAMLGVFCRSADASGGPGVRGRDIMISSRLLGHGFFRTLISNTLSQ